MWRIVFVGLLFIMLLSIHHPSELSAQGPSCVDRFDQTTVVDSVELPVLTDGETILDPTFCTEIQRVDVRSEVGGFETPEYAQLQAFSSDNQYVLLLGDLGYRVRRVEDMTILDLDLSEINAVRWYDATHLVHYDTNADTTVRVQLTNVESGDRETIFTFPEPYERIQVAPSSDELSHDSRWMSGVVQRNDGEWVIFAVDTVDARMGAALPVVDLYADACEPDPEWGVIMPDWVGVSPLGNYLLVQWPRDGIARCSGLETFDLQTGDFLGRVYDGHQHGDVGVSEDGREFFMTFELYHPSGNLAIGVRWLPGSDTVVEPDYVNVIDWGSAEHISCQGPAGVCLITAGELPDNGRGVYEGELFLQYLDGTTQRLAHHRSSSCGYWVQPRATISEDGTLVAFASDWGATQSCDDLGRGDAYFLYLPSLQ